MTLDLTYIIIEFIFGSVENLGKFLASFMIFRFTVSSVWKNSLLAAMVISINDLVLFSMAKLPFYLSEIISFTLLLLILVFLFRIPFWYSVIGGLSSYIMGVLAQILVVLPLTALKIFTIDEIFTSLLPLCIVQFSGAVIGVSVARYLYKRGIGFHFISERVNIQEKINQIVVFALIVSMSIFEYLLHLMLQSNKAEEQVLLYIFSMLAVALFTIYVKVKRDWKNYYANKTAKDLGL